MTDSINEGWHLKKEISVSVIISVIGIAIAGLTAYTDLKKDIELIRADALVLHQRDNQMAVDNDADNKVLNARLDRIDSKLDRLIERQK
jgi:hypothetical protein